VRLRPGGRAGVPRLVVVDAPIWSDWAVSRYAVVSCHVERPLDDDCWSRFSALQERRPGGFRIAALMRPPDPEAGEDERRWLERARAAAERGPLGQHTHFVSPGHARPAAGGAAHGERVRREAAWMAAKGLAATLFCAGGWYMDEGVAEAVAEAGYADCSATAFRPGYLADGAPRGSAEVPVRVALPSGAHLLELPSTHSPGMASRAVLLPSPGGSVMHVYFHDTDLLSARRRSALAVTLSLLGRRRQAIDLDELARTSADLAPEASFDEVFTGRNAPPAE
jgi:hypothetical protein